MWGSDEFRVTTTVEFNDTQVKWRESKLEYDDKLFCFLLAITIYMCETDGKQKKTPVYADKMV